jgi:hypothetical protein
MLLLPCWYGFAVHAQASQLHSSRDLLQIWPLKFRLTSTTRRDGMSPNYAEKRKKHVPKIG